MANAQRSSCEQIQDSQPGFVTKAFVDLDQSHSGTSIYAVRYMSIEPWRPDSLDRRARRAIVERCATMGIEAESPPSSRWAAKFYSALHMLTRSRASDQFPES